MKIARLEIEGFRSLRKISWQPGDLNVVIGPNGSGKSNLLRFLELIAVSAQGRLGKYIQSLGGMDPIVWDGVASSIKFALDMLPRVGALNLDHYELELVRLGAGSSYKIDKEVLTGICQVNFLHRASKLAVIRMGNEFLEEAEENDFLPLVISEASIQDEESLLQVVSGYFSWAELASPAHNGFSSHHEFQEFIASITVYQDLRTDKDAPIRQPTVTRYEKRVEPDGQNLISVLNTLYSSDKDFKRDINSAMNAAFGDDFEELAFPPASDGRFQLRVHWKSLKRGHSAADLSDGTLRFLFLLTVLASPDPPPVIAIDEPETGLHPSMLPVIAEFAQDASLRSQVIFTTHSPQFLDAFTDAQPTTTVALWENGETILRVLPKEELEYWLKDYSLGTLFRSGELEQMG